jgi:Zn-dependent oligopeptidase
MASFILPKTENEYKVLQEKIFEIDREYTEKIIAAPNDTVIKLYDERCGRMKLIISAISFGSRVCVDPFLRSLSLKYSIIIESSLRESIKFYNKFLSVPIPTDPIDIRLYNVINNKMINNGFQLSTNNYKILIDIRSEMANLSNNFEYNLNNVTTHIVFSRQELDGVSQNFFINRTTDSANNYIVDLNYPDYFEIMEYAKSQITREKLYRVYQNRASQNIPILIDLLKLRHAEANILGYKNHAEYVLKRSLAKTPEAASNYIRAILSAIKPHAQKYIDLLKVFKRAWGGSDSTLFEFDANFLSQLIHKDAGVDNIQQYFSAESVLTGTLTIYQKLLGLKFVRVTKDNWHESVLQYDVFDASTKSTKSIGTFFLDMFSREGKYSHYAEFDLQNKYTDVGGKVTQPIVAVVGNFGRGDVDKPFTTNMKFKDVVTFFHEFGHVMHEICTTTPHFLLSGTSTEADFVEAPSQMLENWCYEPEVLKILTNNTIPDKTIKALIAMHKKSRAFKFLQRLSMSMLDLHLHTLSDADVNALTPEILTGLWGKFTKEYGLLDAVEGVNGLGAFGHIASNYSSRYYGYAWSQQYAAAMYSVFREGGLLNPIIGSAYREKILAQGSNKSADELVKDFVGRYAILQDLINALTA